MGINDGWDLPHSVYKASFTRLWVLERVRFSFICLNSSYLEKFVPSLGTTMIQIWVSAGLWVLDSHWMRLGRQGHSAWYKLKGSSWGNPGKLPQVSGGGGVKEIQTMAVQFMLGQLSLKKKLEILWLIWTKLLPLSSGTKLLWSNPLEHCQDLSLELV